MGSAVTKPSENDKVQLQSYVSRVFECLLANTRLANSRKTNKLWKKYWGYPAYPDSASQHELYLQTNRRRAFLLRLFRIAGDIVHTKQISIEDAKLLRSQLSKYRKQACSCRNCVLLAIDAALAHLILKANPQHKRMKLAVSYSAFGEVARVARTYARELRHLFAGIFGELHIFGCTGMKIPLPKVSKVDSVNIHLRNVTISELVAFPGIKAPGLIGSCTDAVRDGTDIIITIDGDARLPLFETIPAIVHIVESEEIDAVLGSRRISGTVISKPGARHLSSMLFASYIEAVMKPVLGQVRDPQAIFKVFRRKQLSCALRRLGFNGGIVSLNNLQSGSLACDLMLLSNLTEDGYCPYLFEVPAIETMAYPTNLQRMLIMTSSNIKAMVATANKPRINVRERSLIGEGTESLVVHRDNGETWKIPRAFERLAQRNTLPISIVTDNRLLQFSMSLPGPLRTFINELASRYHPDRGFGFNTALLDLMVDSRSVIQECLPLDMRIELIENAIRLPFLTAVLMKFFWKFDRVVCNSGTILMRIGMLPMIEVRVIGFIFRIFCSILRWLRLVTRPAIRVLRKIFSLFLSFWDWEKRVLKKILRQTLHFLEIVKALRIFALIDRLDQKSRLFHSCIRVPIRVFEEILWLLESFNISVCLRSPVLCLVQPQTIRPFWTVLEQLPCSMTEEIDNILNMAFELYNKLGDNAYYDCELSLDNLGFVSGSETRVVLIDYGALVNTKKSRPKLIRPWLQNIRKHYEKSYQVYKLRVFANGNSEMENIIEKHIKNSLGLIDKWIHQT
jgi:hypothetical protein